jgi:hypothetical protein
MTFLPFTDQQHAILLEKKFKKAASSIFIKTYKIFFIPVEQVWSLDIFSEGVQDAKNKPAATKINNRKNLFIVINTLSLG